MKAILSLCPLLSFIQSFTLHLPLTSLPPGLVKVEVTVAAAAVAEEVMMTVMTETLRVMEERSNLKVDTCCLLLMSLLCLYTLVCVM